MPRKPGTSSASSSSCIFHFVLPRLFMILAEIDLFKVANLSAMGKIAFYCQQSRSLATQGRDDSMATTTQTTVMRTYSLLATRIKRGHHPVELHLNAIPADDAEAYVDMISSAVMAWSPQASLGMETWFLGRPGRGQVHRN
jgi:hypothetical protein